VLIVTFLKRKPLQVLLKIAVTRMQRGVGWWRFTVDSILTNWWLLGCGIVMTGAGLMWMYILRHYPFSNAYPLTALSFIFGMLAAMWIFREPVNISHWIGVVCIVVGCYLVAR